MNQYQLLNKAGQLMVKLLAAERQRQDEKAAQGLCITEDCTAKAVVNWMCAACWNHHWLQSTPYVRRKIREGK